MSIDVKIFGDRNTCTRLLSRLVSQMSGCALLPEGSYHRAALETVSAMSAHLPAPVSDDARNRMMQLVSDVLVMQRGPLATWKHCEPQFHRNFSDRNVHVLIAVKHPLPWVRSLFRRPYDNLNPRPEEKNLSAFIRAPWIAVRRELGPTIYSDPMEIWNRKARAYLAFIDAARNTACKTMVVHSEDATEDQQAVIDRLLSFTGHPETAIEPVLNSTKDSGRDADFYRDYYANERWRDEFLVEDLAHVARRIDWDAAGRLGYQHTRI